MLFAHPQQEQSHKSTIIEQGASLVTLIQSQEPI